MSISRIAIARERMDEFDRRSSICPICDEWFKFCGHSVKEASDRLFENYIRSIVVDERECKIMAESISAEPTKCTEL